MLILRQSQIDALAEVPREQFLRDIARHLETLCRSTTPPSAQEFTSTNALAHLRAELRALLDRGFSSAHDLAAALELIHIFGVDPRGVDASRILDDPDLAPEHKLDRLSRLSSLGDRQ